MLDVFRVEEEPQLLQLLDDLRIGVPDVHAFEELHLVYEDALFVDGGIDIEAILEPRLVVLLAVARRGVDRARPRIGRDVVCEDDDGLPVDEGMFEM
jgi:hypothetical protein